MKGWGLQIHETFPYVKSCVFLYCFILPCLHLKYLIMYRHTKVPLSCKPSSTGFQYALSKLKPLFFFCLKETSHAIPGLYIWVEHVDPKLTFHTLLSTFCIKSKIFPNNDATSWSKWSNIPNIPYSGEFACDFISCSAIIDSAPAVFHTYIYIYMTMNMKFKHRLKI